MVHANYSDISVLHKCGSARTYIYMYVHVYKSNDEAYYCNVHVYMWISIHVYVLVHMYIRTYMYV